MKRTYPFISLLLITSLAQTSHAQTKPEMIDSLMIRSNRLGIFNGNILVIDGNKEIYRKAIGYTDTTRKAMLTDQYRFHIGSISKEFNAVGIMMLEEQGKLSLDDKISKYLTDLPDWSETITIRNLLQYASGLPDLKWKTIVGDAAAMDSLKAVNQLDFPPGSRYAYNNSNTLLQRQIIAKISGISFKEFVGQHMLKPLKMQASIVDPTDNTPLMAKSFNDNNIQPPLKAPISGWTAVTLDDFYKWEQSLENFTLISPQATQTLVTPFSPNKQCGLGSGTMSNNTLTLHIHDGTSQNYQALLSADPTLGRTIILMTNNKQNTLYPINEAIQNILDGKPFEQPSKSLLTTL